MTTLYSQRDPRWADLPLGFGKQTIGQVGCLLTCLAMLAQDFTDAEMTPDSLNRVLCRRRAFVNGNEIALQSNPLRFLGLELLDFAYCEQSPAPVSRIHSALASNLGVIVKVAFRPESSYPHYVRVVEQAGDDFLIADPWLLPNSGLVHMLPRYALPDWDAARTILRVAVFGRKE